MKQLVYLDYAAATPMDPEVSKAMRPYFSDKFYNPSAAYLSARALRNELEAVRRGVAEIMGARTAEIAFVPGATEANNLAIQGVMRSYPQGEILTSAIEHESVLEPARLFKTKEIPVDGQGQVILNELRNLISDKTVLLSVMLVNNELGSIQPLREIARLADKVRSQRLAAKNKLPLYLHTDAAQAPNYLDIHVSRLGIDLMSLNGSKIYGPKQSGVLYIKAGTNIAPLIVGGGQENGWRSGTENVAAIIGFYQALKLAQSRRPEDARKTAEIKDIFETKLQEQIPKIVINGSIKHCAPHISSITISGYDNERLMMELDEMGIQCAVGSACSASRQDASHVLSAIGLNDDSARSTLRFSFGRQTTKADIQRAISALVNLAS